MRKILVSTILGVGIAGTANASIVSSGFLDEKLTEMTNATTLQLDNKANQSDLTELSNIVAKSGWNTENASLEISSFPFTNEFGFESTGSWVNTTRGIVDMLGQYNANIMFPGLAGVTYKLTNGWTSDVGIGLRFEKYNQYNPGLEGMFSGWTIYNPSGSETMVFNGLEYISSQFRTVEDAYHIGLAKLLLNGETKVVLEDRNYTGPVYPLWKLSEGIDKIETKIGDLPTEIPNTNLIWEKYGFAETGTPIDLPDTIGGMFAMLFSDYGSYNEPSLESIMARILMGFSSSSNVRFEGLSSLTSVYKLVGDSPIVTAVKANTAKIGTLPDGYDSVGAALTAIKGIAEDAKAAALAAIPDPKQEGSSGKFVLTVDIVGDNATYRWEKIDREGETTTE